MVSFDVFTNHPFLSWLFLPVSSWARVSHQTRKPNCHRRWWRSFSLPRFRCATPSHHVVLQWWYTSASKCCQRKPVNQLCQKQRQLRGSVHVHSWEQGGKYQPHCLTQCTWWVRRYLKPLRKHVIFFSFFDWFAYLLILAYFSRELPSSMDLHKVQVKC